MNADKIIAFYKRQRAEHVAAVNRYAAKIGRSFPAHDADMFVEPMLSRIARLKWCQWHHLNTHPRMIQAGAAATGTHRRSNPHHPEYWERVSDMTVDAIAEMCCDWCAVNTGRGKYPTPMDFYKNSALPKYKFTKEQQALIEELITKIME